MLATVLIILAAGTGVSLLVAVLLVQCWGRRRCKPAASPIANPFYPDLHDTRSSFGKELAKVLRGRPFTAGIAVLVAALLASSARAAAVPLGTAESFAVLAGSTVTNTGPSVISGDLGVSPGTAVTGFPPGTVTAGTIHAADSVAAQAESDLAIAYANAAGRSSTATISADLAGRTLTPGVYTSSSSLGLSGDLTLDAQGDPNAVFVFQAGSTLTVGSASHVLLIGAAQACNVFWQVGSSATLGSSSAFAGNILALTSISLTTDATLSGRALARNGAVTLDTNAITKTTCAAATLPPPSASDTAATTAAGQPVTLLLHGTDGTGAPLTYAIASEPSHGTLAPINQGAGTVAYTPSGGYTGTDTFTYQVASNNGTSNTATAAVTITAGAGGTTATPGANGATGATEAGGTGGAPTNTGATTGGATGGILTGGTIEHHRGRTGGTTHTTGVDRRTTTADTGPVTTSSALPFTGLNVLWLLLGGLTLLGTGMALRRLATHP